MFIHKTLLAAILLIGTGGAFSMAQTQDSNSTSAIAQGQDTPEPKVAPMSEEDATITKCEVHHTDLKVEDVRLSYGKPFVVEGYFEAQEKEFPHSKLKVLAGCILSPDSPRMQTVKFCPDCRETENKWLTDHTPKK